MTLFRRNPPTLQTQGLADKAKQEHGLAIGASDIAIKGGEVVGEVVSPAAPRLGSISPVHDDADWSSL